MREMITATGLVKRYKSVEALAGLDLSVEEGQILALLGPNGAGKTTAVRILATLLERRRGQRHRSPASTSLTDPEVSGRGSGCRASTPRSTSTSPATRTSRWSAGSTASARRASRTRARELLERFDLTDAADRPSKTYSGGMRRRLDLAGALVAEPPVLILDEPTTGLDVRSRQQMWEVIRELVSDGATLLLTTQYLEEADRLADDIVVIDHGTAIARGTADALKAQIGGERIEVVLRDVADRSRPRRGSCWARWRSVRCRRDDSDRALVAAVDGGAGALRTRPGGVRVRADRGGRHRPAPTHARRRLPEPHRPRRRRCRRRDHRGARMTSIELHRLDGSGPSATGGSSPAAT